MAIDLEVLQDSPHLLDILLQMEDVLDSLDIYVSKNWFKGELIDGPNVRRYWLGMTLRYDYHDMPNPKGALRLTKHGIKVQFNKVDDERDAEDSEAEKQDDDRYHWEITIEIPRRIIGQFSTTELDFYDDEVDIDDVQDARDSGMNDETGYDREENDDFNNDSEENDDQPF